MEVRKRPYISIVIPAYNSASTLGQTIHACLAQDYPKDKLEVIVIDDGSKDNTRRIIGDFPVRYIYQQRSGPASARNNGWRNSRGEGICFIDADCVPHSNWVSKLAGHYDRDNVGAVAGTYAVDESRYLLDRFVHYEIRYRHSMMSEYTNSFGTYNVLIKRSVLEELDGFDPLYCNASGEDTDLSYRIVKRGHKIYFEKEALVGHSSILRSLKYFMVQFRHGYWRMKLYKKNISMVTRDEYGYWKDFLEVFLAMTLMVCLLLDFKTRFMVVSLLAACLFIIQLPLSIRISLKEKDIRYLIFSVLTFIRPFVRILGGILGFIVFWIIRR